MIELPDHIPDLRRLKCFAAVLFMMFGVLIARLWYLQIVKGPELAALSETQRTRLIRRVAPRGTILDDKGRVLASSRPHRVVAVLPDEMKKNPQVLPLLAQLLHMTEAEIQEKIDQNRTTPFDPVPLTKDDLDMTLLSQLEEQKFDLPGVLIMRDPIRDYQDNGSCTHVLGIARPISAEKLEKLRSKGYRGGDLIGVEGIEATYESDLRGKDGGQRVEVDARGRMRRSLEEVTPVAGHTLRLTIDLDLQKIAYEALMESGHPGAVVALDPNDGAVLAFVSAPSYDLNRFGSDYNKIKDTPGNPLINRVCGSAYPNGSTFKLVTAAAGMESGTLSPSTRYYCSGALRMGRRVFHCDKRSGHGSLALERAIGESCDVYFWRVAERAGRDALAEWAKKFGLGSPTGIALTVDRKGIVPTPEWKKKRKLGPWVPGDLLNMAIGQGFVNVTPLQLVDYTAALANGGTLLRPQLVREITGMSNARTVVLHRLKREVRGTLGIKPETRDAIVNGMVDALQPGGTAASSAIPGLEIAGKTGTAEVFIKGKPANNSLFTCFAPVQHPRIAVTVVVEGGGFGADTAAPIARRILAHFFGLHVQNTPIGHHNGGD
jgi:penicillin-binding protein 2